MQGTTAGRTDFEGSAEDEDFEFQRALEMSLQPSEGPAPSNVLIHNSPTCSSGSTIAGRTDFAESAEDEDIELQRALEISLQHSEGTAQPNVRVQSTPTYSRSLSLINPEVAGRIREKVNPDKIVTSSDRSASWMDTGITNVFNTLVLQAFGSFSRPVASYLYWRLLDVDRLVFLQNCGVLNNVWRSDRMRVEQDSQIITLENQAAEGGGGDLSALLPMRVDGDGNCLLHACSVALWGIQDRLHTLRVSLNKLMLQQSEVLFRRWKLQQMEWDAEDAAQMQEAGIERTEGQWRQEFDDLVERSGQDRAFLCEIHVYVLAHVLRRPIIVYANSFEHMSPCRFSGLYLPLEWTRGNNPCETAPLLLAYSDSHFVPLVYHLQDFCPQETRPREKWPLIPLCVVRNSAASPPHDLALEALPIRFGFDNDGNNDIAALYLTDPLGALESYLPVEALDNETPPHVGVRMNLNELSCQARHRSPANVDLLSNSVTHLTSALLRGWLSEAREAALESSFLATEYNEFDDVPLMYSADAPPRDSRDVDVPLRNPTGGQTWTYSRDSREPSSLSAARTIVRENSWSLVRENSDVGRALKAMKEQEWDHEIQKAENFSGSHSTPSTPSTPSSIWPF